MPGVVKDIMKTHNKHSQINANDIFYILHMLHIVCNNIHHVCDSIQSFPHIINGIIHRVWCYWEILIKGKIMKKDKQRMERKFADKNVNTRNMYFWFCLST